MGGGTFFKVKRNECKSKIQKVCGLNWQMWRHQHWIMTSITFVSMF